MSDSRVAVIGTGYWGRNLVRNFAALDCLAAICDQDADALASQAAAHPDVAAHDSVDAILAAPEIDAVAIATPAATHGILVKRALAAGKHVFVEKPLCLDLAEAAALKADSERRGRVLMIGHLLLYHPAFDALRQTIARGRLGALRYIYSNRLSLGKIRREENALWSFAPHDISMILALAGAMPERVMAAGGHFLSHDVADTTFSHLTFPDGLQAHVFVSWLHPYKDQRLVVVGSEAMAVFNDVADGRDKLLLYPHQAAIDGELPVVRKADAEPVDYAPGEPLRRECEAYLNAIVSGTRPPSDADEAIRVLTVLDASQRALNSGQPVGLAPDRAA